MKSQTELLAPMLNQQQRRPSFALPEAVADRIHQPWYLAVTPIREPSFRPFTHEHPLLKIRNTANNVDQFVCFGVRDHVFM